MNDKVRKRKKEAGDAPRMRNKLIALEEHVKD
jgi:hypothetical protein